jgi:hypothetical protein
MFFIVNPVIRKGGKKPMGFKKRINSVTWVMSLVAGLSVLAMGFSVPAAAEDTQTDGYVENATYYRSGRGLSKFRNTLQLEFEKPLKNRGAWSVISLNGVLRGT